MSSYCRICEREVPRCWDAKPGCCGGGHCLECGGYEFETDEEQNERQANEALTKILTNEHNFN